MGGLVRSFSGILGGLLGGIGGADSEAEQRKKESALAAGKVYTPASALSARKVGDLKNSLIGESGGRYTAADLGQEEAPKMQPATPVPPATSSAPVPEAPKFALSAPKEVASVSPAGPEMISKGGDAAISSKQEDLAKQASVDERRKKARKPVTLLGLTNPTSNLSGL